MFKRSRFAPQSYETDFDSHFLRWMLADGAGACLLGKHPRRSGLSLKLNRLRSACSVRSTSSRVPVSGSFRPCCSWTRPSAYAARLLGTAWTPALIHSKHPLVPLSTMKAGFRLVLHGLATEMQHALLVQYKCNA